MNLQVGCPIQSARGMSRGIPRFTPILVSLFILLAPVCGFGEEYKSLDQMSVGDIQITEYGDSIINVKARCVPAQTLLESMAKYLDKPVKTDAQLQNFFSVWAGDDKRPAEWWLRRALERNEYGGLVSEESCWRVLVPDASGGIDYDPTLTQSEVIALRVDDSIAPVNRGWGIQKGLLFIDGHFLPPPYAIELTMDKTDMIVAVNSVRVAKFPLESPISADTIDFERDGIPQFVETYPELVRVAGKICRDAADRGDTWDQARLAVLSYIQQQSKFEIIDASEPFVRILILESNILGEAMPSDVMYFFGAKQSSRVLNATATEQAHGVEAGIRRSLESDSIILESRSGRVEFNGVASVAQFLAAISGDYALFERECLLNELTERPDVSRKLAVNLFEKQAEVVAAVTGLLRRVRESKGSENAVSVSEPGIQDDFEELSR